MLNRHAIWASYAALKPAYHGGLTEHTRALHARTPCRHGEQALPLPSLSHRAQGQRRQREERLLCAARAASHQAEIAALLICLLDGAIRLAGGRSQGL